MQRLEWHEGLATGDEVIDRQHREIYALTREIAAIVERGGDTLLIGDVLYGLMRYVLIHFADEEALMARVGYPHLERQRREHERYRTTAASMTAAFLDGKVSADTILDYMLAWWNEHILGEDLLLAEYARARGTRGFDA